MRQIFNTKHLGWVDNNTTALCYFEIFMDSASDLPSDVYEFSTDTEKYKIAMGSLAWDISTGDMYQMKSDGTWVTN